MSLMLEELLSAPAYLKNVLKTNRQTISSLSDELKQKNISFFTTVARGTSNNAANYFKYVCEEKSGFMVSKFNHSVTTIANKTTILKQSLCIGISQSGMSDDTIKVMEMAKKQGALTLAVTNNPLSPLAKLCKYHLYLNCEEEKSVAATKTFTMQIACMQILAAIIANKTVPQMDKIAMDLFNFTKTISTVKEFAQETKDINNMIILSRGETLALANEMSLKLLETCYKMSRCYSVAEFAHGPYALVEKGRTVIMLAPDGIYKKDYVAIAKRLKNDGATIIAFTNIDKIINCLSDYHIKIDYKNENPYFYILTLQAYAAFMAEELGLNPDKPRGLCKVTNTF